MTTPLLSPQIEREFWDFFVLVPAFGTFSVGALAWVAAAHHAFCRMINPSKKAVRPN
jgi:hypothetical protein